MNTSILSNLQDALITRIESQDWPVDIIKGRYGKEITFTSRLSLVVEAPFPKQAYPYVIGPFFERVVLSIKIVSNTYLSVGGPKVLEVGEFLSKLLHGWKPSIRGIYGPLRLEPSNTWRVEKETKNDPYESLILSFYVAVDLGANIEINN